MIKMTAVIRRKPGMTQNEYFSYIVHVHGAIAKENPLTIRRYVQSHVFDSAFGAATDPAYQQHFHRDSVTELSFDSLESMIATFSDPHTKEKAGPDGANFNDLSTTMAMISREVEHSVPHAGEGKVKVMYFLRKPADLPMEDYIERWNRAHRIAMEDRQIAGSLRRYAQSLQTPEGAPLLAYFGGKDIPIFEGYASLWFDESKALESFRAYQKAFEANLQPEPFFTPSESFFLMTREVPIIEA